MNGLICLDIDGTLTSELTHIPAEVASCLHRLYKKKWQIALVTGRTFSFASTLLEALHFPYTLALQNGADILSMPNKKLLRRCYIKAPLIGKLSQIYEDQKEEFIIYAGYERGDFCYFRPERFSETLLLYLYELKELSKAPWEALKEFAFDQGQEFPLIKCFGSKELMLFIASRLAAAAELTTSVIKDPICPELFLNLVTSSSASKGTALCFLRDHFKAPHVIAAGDDRNDLPMLQVADQKIVMANAPDEVKEVATLIARPALELGIIEALELATKLDF